AAGAVHHVGAGSPATGSRTRSGAPRRRGADHPGSGRRAAARADRRAVASAPDKRRGRCRRSGFILRGPEREPHAQLGAAARHQRQRSEAGRSAAARAVRPRFRSGRDAQPLRAAARTRPRARNVGRPDRFARGRAGDAVRLLDGAARQGHSDRALLRALGTVLRDTGELRRSADVLEALVKDDESDLQAADALGQTYARMARYADAETQFTRVISRSPNASTTWNNLGSLYLA